MTRKTLAYITTWMGAAGFVVGWFLWRPVLIGVYHVLPPPDDFGPIYSPFAIFERQLWFARSVAILFITPGVAALVRHRFRPIRCYGKTFLTTSKVTLASIPFLVCLWLLAITLLIPEGGGYGYQRYDIFDGSGIQTLVISWSAVLLVLAWAGSGFDAVRADRRQQPRAVTHL